MPPTKMKAGSENNRPAGKRHRKQVEKGTDEYMQKRERNNVAVKKSRERTRQKALETQSKVERLKSENAQLEQKVQLLQKELSVLKDLFLAHAGSVREEQRVKEEPMIVPAMQVNQKAVRNDHEYTISNNAS